MIIPSKFSGYGEGGRVSSVRRVFDSGGGGGDATQTQVSDLPDWAKPYAKDTLGQAAALTDVNQNPYQTYGGQRIADFSGLQTQAQTAAGNLTNAPQMAAATGIAGQAAGQALGAGSNFNPYQASMMSVQAPGLQNFQMGPAQQVRTQSFTQPGAAESYMNPYMQNVVDIQKREATRQSDILRNQQQAQAVGAGAFGGSRQAIVEAERQRNLGQQLGDIQAQGSQAAFNAAQQQFNAEQQARLAAQQANQQAGLTTGQANLQALLGVQNLGATQGLAAQQANQQAFQNAQQLAEQSRQYGAGLGLQGLQTALTGAGQLANIGQQQFAQNQDIINLQNQMGAQQQTQQQNILSQQYQDFLNQQKYPYQQLEFMSNILRGTPMGTVQTLYGAEASPISQLAGLGTAAYGASKLMAEGGSVDTPSNGLMDLAIAEMMGGDAA